MVDTLEHALMLGMQLPEYQLVYASADKSKVDSWRRQGFVPESFRYYTPKEKRKVIKAIENGEIRKVIATTTLGTGVDMRNLDVFVRADGGSSEITNIQYRGRVARGSHGYYLDLYDFGDGRDDERGPRESAAYKRYRSCKKEGWDPEQVDML
jgi:ERCC4-related helicase